MPLRNTPDSYGAVTKTLHWLMALVFISLLALGLVMKGIPAQPDSIKLKFALYGLHKSLGITILALAALRILWHVWSRRPAALATLAPAERVLAALMHYGLYGFMLVLPLSGWLMSSTAGRPVSFFGLFTLPDLAAPNEEISKLARAFHGYAAYTAMAAVALHFLAALKHHFISKDAVLRRMLPLLLLISLPAHAAQKWDVDPAQSKITFGGKQMGTAFSGTFKNYTTDIAFSPDDLAGSHARVTFQTASADTGDAERDSNLKAKEWLDTAAFPEAVFDAAAFAKTDSGFTATGTLKIKDVSVPVTLPFTFTRTGDAATVDGQVTLDRAALKLGAGEWADPSVIANEIPVTIHLVAKTR